MALQFKLLSGSDLTLSKANTTIVRKFRATDRIPLGVGGDHFDYVATAALSWVQSNVPQYASVMGTLYWNSIQVHETFYGLLYEISVTYSDEDWQSGAYQITVDQAVGSHKATAGEYIESFPAADAPTGGSGGTFFDGYKITGIDWPVNEDKITISYRHTKGYLNHAYIKRIGRLRGYPNKDTFLGYEPGEVLYMGGQFTESNCEASASYNFNISPNIVAADNLVVGGVEITTKKGFDSASIVYKAGTGKTGGGAVKDIREVEYIDIIRVKPWKDYVTIFGWGG